MDPNDTGTEDNTSYLKLFEGGFQNLENQYNTDCGITVNSHIVFENILQQLPETNTTMAVPEKQGEADIYNSMVVSERSSMAPDPIPSSFDPTINTSQLYEEECIPKEGGDSTSQDVVEVALHAEVREVWSNPDSKAAFMVDYLISTSDEFLDKAHREVLICNYQGGHLKYCTLIKSGLKCLHLLLDKYHRKLSGEQLATIYYKLAKLYFFETGNVDNAELYIEKSITLATQSQSKEIQFYGEFLKSKILQKTNPNLILNYLDNKISQYSNMKSISDIFAILKIENSLLINKDNAFRLLQKLIQTADSILKIYCLILQISLHLYRGSPEKASSLLIDVESYLQSNQQSPPQLEAMILLMKFHSFVKLNDNQQSNICMKNISSFIKSQSQNKWIGWRGDGIFTLNIPLDSVSFVPFQITWLSSEEFVIMYYFITGLCLLFESDKSKSKRVFGKAIATIESQLKQLNGVETSNRNLSINQLNNKIIRLKVIKFNINYYQVWLNFLNNDFSSMSYLNEFMLAYNDQQFSDEEFTYFKLLLPRVFYLMGIYYQFHGDIQAAKYYYYKVINLTSENKPKFDQESAKLQLHMGIGCDSIVPESEYSELYIYAIMNLLTLNEYEQAEASKTNTEAKVHYHHKLNQELYGRLSSAFKPKNSSNDLSESFYGSDQFLNLTYQILRNAYTIDDNDNDQVLTSKLIQSLDQKFSYPFVYKLLLYVSYIKSEDLEVKTKLFNKCLETVSECTTFDIDGTINVLILRSLMKQLKANEIYDEAEKAELQLQSYARELSSKFAFLSNNVDRY